jgi:hypothetical protein
MGENSPNLVTLSRGSEVETSFIFRTKIRENVFSLCANVKRKNNG